MAPGFRFSPARLRLLIVVGLVALTVVSFFGLGRNGFISYDDHEYITENPQVRRGLTIDGVAWAFTTMSAANWHPLTWMSHMLDVDLFGLNPGGHHLMGLGIHTASAVALFMVLSGMTGALWMSAVVAALFAIHPLHVESVAWASERKDLLCGFFWILGLGAHACYARRPSLRRYGLVALACGLALLSKPMAVTFPLALLLLDYWPLGRTSGLRPPRWWLLMAEKVPLLALGAAVSAVTLAAQRQDGAMVLQDTLTLSTRVSNAVVSYVLYLRMTFWPGGLAAFYPHPERPWPAAVAIGSFAVLAAATAATWAWRRRRPWLLTGWVWFIVTLLPVIGLIQVGTQALADRYTYLPLVGLFLGGAWGALRWVRASAGFRQFTPLAVVLLLAVLSVLTSRQVATWRTGVTMATRLVSVMPGDWRARHMLGWMLLDTGREGEAVAEFEEALRRHPDSAETHQLLGAALERLKRFAPALGHYEEAARLDPANPWARRGIGRVLAALGRREELPSRFETFVRARPRDAAVRKEMGYLLAERGALDQARETFAAAVALAPRDPEARYNHAIALDRLGRVVEAEAGYRETLRLDPHMAKAYNNLAIILAGSGRHGEAEWHFKQALRIDPDYGQARENLRNMASGQP